MPISKKRQSKKSVKSNQSAKAQLLLDLITQGKEFAITMDARQPSIKLAGIDRSNPSFQVSLNPLDRDMRIELGSDNVLRCEMRLDYPPQSPELMKMFSSQIPKDVLNASKQFRKAGKQKPLFSVGVSVVVPLHVIYLVDDLTTEDRFLFREDVPKDLKLVDEDQDTEMTPEEDAMFREAFANAIRQVFSAEIGADETERLVNDFLSDNLDVPECDLSAEEKAEIEKICANAISETISEFNK